MDIYSELKSHIASVYKNVPMCEYTTLRIGGPADILVETSSIDDIVFTQKTAKQYNLPLFALGRGSNILVGDKGIRGIVLHIGKNFESLSVKENCIYAESGAMLSCLAKFAAENSLKGLEFSGGIPGTVGGAVIMNAGAYGGEMKDVVKYVDFSDKDGNVLRYSSEEMDFNYRHSSLQGNGSIVLGVGFSLEKGDTKQIKETILELNRRRAAKQPLDKPSCGSVFKRPEGKYAAALIENCELKGLRIGGCSVSTKHAGFIINDGNCTAKEYIDLIHTGQERVYKATGYKLETEVRLVGEF